MRAFLLTFALTIAAIAGVVDRVAVVVGNQIFTESEVLLEARLTEFMNGQPLDLSPAQRRAAAERLVDQQLIRNEMQVGGYAMPAESQADTLLRNFRQQNYHSIPAFRAALQKYELTEDGLKAHLLWQVAALHFAEQRFRLAMPVQAASPAPPPSQGTSLENVQSADRAKDDAAEDQMDVWLKQARANTRIQFKKGAFQ